MLNSRPYNAQQVEDNVRFHSHYKGMGGLGQDDDEGTSVDLFSGSGDSLPSNPVFGTVAVSTAPVGIGGTVLSGTDLLLLAAGGVLLWAFISNKKGRR